MGVVCPVCGSESACVRITPHWLLVPSTLRLYKPRRTAADNGMPWITTGCLYNLFISALTGSILAGLTVPASGQNIPVAQTSRLVVTFFKQADVTPGATRVIKSGGGVGGVSVVKIYGRRLVLQFPGPVNLAIDGERVRGWIGAQYVERIELDARIIMQQLVSITENVTVDIVQDTGDLVGEGINYEMYGAAPPSTPLWNLMDAEEYSIHAEGAWLVTNSTPEVVVAVLDTGMAEVAEGLFMNLGQGYDFVSDDWISMDGDGRDRDAVDPGDGSPECGPSSWHGTRVASILAARHELNVSLGLKGVAQNATVLPVRVLGECRSGYASDVADAIVWAAGGEIIDVEANPTPAKIISMSFAGRGECPDFLQSAVTHASNLGAILIAAAGNAGLNTTDYFPANCEGVLAVAASTRRGTLAEYSNYGPNIAVAAPGGDVQDSIMMLTIDDSDYTNPLLAVDYGMGTSFAVPHVAGVAALALSISNDSIKLQYALRKLTMHPNTSMGSVTDFGILDFRFIQIFMYVFDQTQLYPVNTNGSLDFNSSLNNLTVPAAGIGGTLPTALPTCAVGNVPNLYYQQAPTGLNSDFSYQCEAPRWVCAVSIAIHLASSSVVGIAVYCCDINGLFPIISQTFASPGIWDTIPLSGYFYVWSPIQQFKWSCKGYSFPGQPYSIATLNNYPNTFSMVYGDVSGTAAGCAASVFTTQCPTNQYVTGIYGNYWSYLDKVIGICNPLCAACNAGKYSTDGLTCITCPSGAYSGSGAGSCTACPSNSNSAAGASACACNAGYFSASGTAPCNQCPVGQYSISPGSTVCSSCMPGSYSGTAGASSASTCTSCPAGSFTSVIGASACYLCPAGYYSTAPGAPTNTVCSSCAAGGYSTASGAQSSGTCIQCSVGSYSAAAGASSASTCASCSAGTYSGVLGATACTACTAGKYSSLSGYTACMNCDAGKYSSLSGSLVCTNCDAGKFSSLSGLLTCTNCDAGKYSSLSGSPVCTNCDAGKYSSLSGLSICANCNAGTYSTVSGGTVCASCPAGSYSSASGVSACSSCAAGTYLATTGAQSSATCTSCPAGTYSGVPGVSVCTSCTSGTTYATSLGSTACKQCNAISCSGGYVITCSPTADAACGYCNPALLTPNAYYTSTGDSTCPWACNTGYYKTGATCVACSTSSKCSTGQYITNCNVGGNPATADGICTPCTNGPAAGTFSYTGVSNAPAGVSNCPWGCTATYFLSSDSSACCLKCTNKGTYNVGCISSNPGTCTGYCNNG